MTALPLTSLITLFVVLLMFATALNVGRARGLYGIKAPAVTGHEMFDRAFRVQMNTLESAAVMLPALWLYAGFIGDRGAGMMGVVWLVARIWYAIAYQRDPKTRGAAFGIAFLVFVGLWLGAFWGVLRVLLR
jgi:glutathione S-transferase